MTREKKQIVIRDETRTQEMKSACMLYVENKIHARTRGRGGVGAEEEEQEAEHDDERYDVHRPLLPRRPRGRRLLGLGLDVVVVAAEGGFLRQELGHRGDAQLPLHSVRDQEEGR